VAFPERARAQAADGAQGAALGVREGVAGRPVQPAVGVDLVELLGLGAVREDADFLLELQELLLDVEDLAAGGVADVDLRRERHQLEGEGDGELERLGHGPPVKRKRRGGFRRGL
jgi:hypothetical protein